MPTFNCLRKRELSAPVSELIQFDADSIRRVARARQGSAPDVWVVDPDRYEQNGRTLRDSELARMVAYSKAEQLLYATDGCNSCVREVSEKLGGLAPAELRTFADENGLPLELLQHLVSLL